MSLIIFSAITEDISEKNTKVPPPLQQRVLSETVGQIEETLKNDKKAQFNFNKIYQNNLRAFAMRTEESDTGETETKWVKISSKINDPDNFKENMERLKILSHDTWCTKATHTEEYLAFGDFHIYLDKGKPRLGMEKRALLDGRVRFGCRGEIAVLLERLAGEETASIGELGIGVGER